MPINSIYPQRPATDEEIDFSKLMVEHYQERVKALPANYKTLLFLRQCYRQHKAVLTSKMIGTI